LKPSFHLNFWLTLMHTKAKTSLNKLTSNNFTLTILCMLLLTKFAIASALLVKMVILSLLSKDQLILSPLSRSKIKS
jgi:hypothetical protein